MKQRKFYLLVLVFLLIFVGIAGAQSSPNFEIPSIHNIEQHVVQTIVQRIALFSGGTAVSENYRVKNVIGQPATDVVVSANYKVSGGFLFPLGQGSGSNQNWLPLIVK